MRNQWHPGWCGLRLFRIRPTPAQVPLTGAHHRYARPGAWAFPPTGSRSSFELAVINSTQIRTDQNEGSKPPRPCVRSCTSREDNAATRLVPSFGRLSPTSTVRCCEAGSQFQSTERLKIFVLTGVDPTGTYHGDSDLQLERINVYYNEVTI
jgi:hypothetical protein